MSRSTIGLVVAAWLFGSILPASAADYEVGPGQAHTSIGQVPWEILGPGDRVLIHWRDTPYAEKWVICRQGTEADPIVISGVPGPSGELPIIDGRDAVTRTALNYWNEGRGVIKIGGASIPADTLPANIVIEAEGEGNSQIVHYGGDSGTTADYRKGILFFYNNTVVSTRTGNTTLMRLSTNDESADVRNNIIYTTATGSHLAMLSSSGVMDLGHNWLTSGWVTSHSWFAGSLNDDGTNLEGTDPGFGQDYSLELGSPCVDAGTTLNPAVLPDHDLTRQYVPHQGSTARPDDPALDLGAFELGLIFADGFESGGTGQWSAP